MNAERRIPIVLVVVSLALVLLVSTSTWAQNDTARLSDVIKDQPITSALVAIGIGYLLGRFTA